MIKKNVFKPREWIRQASSYCIYSSGYYLHGVYILFSNFTDSWGGVCFPLLGHTSVTLQTAGLMLLNLSLQKKHRPNAVTGNSVEPILAQKSSV